MFLIAAWVNHVAQEIYLNGKDNHIMSHVIEFGCLNISSVLQNSVDAEALVPTKVAIT